jgi:hypothetical protein
VSLELSHGEKLWAYPAVGVPTAELLHDVVEKASRAAQDGTPILVYDGVGIRDSWRKHLGWLNENIHAIQAIPVGELGWNLAGWGA